MIPSKQFMPSLKLAPLLPGRLQKRSDRGKDLVVVYVRCLMRSLSFLKRGRLILEYFKYRRSMCNARFGLFSHWGRETGYEALFMPWSVWNHWHKTPVQIRRAEHDCPDVLRSGFSAKFSAKASLGMWCLPCRLGRNHFENIVEFPGVEDQRVLCFVCCGSRVGRG